MPRTHNGEMIPSLVIHIGKTECPYSGEKWNYILTHNKYKKNSNEVCVVNVRHTTDGEDNSRHCPGHKDTAFQV